MHQKHQSYDMIYNKEVDFHALKEGDIIEDMRSVMHWGEPTYGNIRIGKRNTGTDYRIYQNCLIEHKGSNGLFSVTIRFERMEEDKVLYNHMGKELELREIYGYGRIIIGFEDFHKFKVRGGPAYINIGMGI